MRIIFALAFLSLSGCAQTTFFDPSVSGSRKLVANFQGNMLSSEFHYVGASGTRIDWVGSNIDHSTATLAGAKRIENYSMLAGTILSSAAVAVVLGGL